MSADPTLVAGGNLGEVVRQIVADVLMVPVARVQPTTELVMELGAESIDFLDVVFRLEQALGKKIPLSRWGDFVKERLAGQDLASGITTDIVREFAEHEAAVP
ncbi:MAG: hypothetical protein DMF82_21700 [Acidobacteria bacterium]|nr:MAG: hypothetical protein DMF82_21700 [Acidobacteriota bacterium]